MNFWKNMKRWATYIVLILISTINTLAYANSPVRLKGDHITISQELVVAVGNIYAEYKDIILKASYLELDPKTWILKAEGNVSVTQEKNTLTGERLILFLKEDKFQLDNVKGEVTDRNVKGFIYIRGSSLERDPEGSIKGKWMSFTTCDLETPHYHIKARELEIYPQERLYARDVSFYIGNTKIFSLPYYNLLFDYPDRQPFIPEIGNSTDKGYYIKTFYSHYQSRDLYGYATLELAEKTGVGLGLTEFYNIKNVGLGSVNIYVLPTLEEIKANLGITQEVKIGDIKLNGMVTRESVFYDRWEYRISASSKGYSLSHQGLENRTSNVSSYNTNIGVTEKIGDINTSISLSNRYYESGGIPIESNDYRITATTKIGDVNTSISLRDRYYKRYNVPAEVGEYRITANTKVQNMSIRGEVFTISYPDTDSLSQFGYFRILTKVPELSLGSSIPISPDISVTGEINAGNYIELPTNIQGYAIKGNILAVPKIVKVFGGDLESSLRINGSYYLPESYIAGLGLNAKWTKDLSQNLKLN
ncbi:LPS-assembly protein LptD, partial [bacterium]|nr:LPS-assembly protein LptD [bacterium]